MLLILSPAKIQNFSPQNSTTQFSQPEFLNDAQKIVKSIKKLSAPELARLLDINGSLAQLNADRYFNWQQPFTPDNAKQAVLVFNGEVFRGLDASSFTNSDFDYAQQHLRIFSGLYGVLRPLDLIQPYRLEVSSKFENQAVKDLYAYWQKKVTASVLRALKDSGNPTVLINLASSEYFKTLDLKHKKVKVIDVEFYEYRNDKFKQIVIYTKKARGLMARYIIENRIENVDDLKGFDAAGYWYSPQLSTDRKLVFIR